MTKFYDLTQKESVVDKLYDMCENAASTKKISYYWYEKRIQVNSGLNKQGEK